MLTKAFALLLVQAAFYSAMAQAPRDFKWLDTKQPSPTLATVTKAIPKDAFTSISRIGVLRDHALVFTALHDASEPTAVDDERGVFEVNLPIGTARLLLTGYHIHSELWLQLSPGESDLTMVYLDCWECEPASLFAALHFDPRKGWVARWAEKDLKQPGIVFRFTDVGDPYTDEDVDQVFAVFAPPDGLVTVGTWYHAVDTKTHKVEQTVLRCGIEPRTNKDVCTELRGADAQEWKIKLCEAKDAAAHLAIGQQTKSCKQILASGRVR
jgi:hypothetical protein